MTADCLSPALKKSGHAFDFIIQNIYLGEFENVSNVTLYEKSAVAGQGFYAGFEHITYEVTGLANGISKIKVGNGYIKGADIASDDRQEGILLIALYKSEELIGIKTVDNTGIDYNENGAASVNTNIKIPGGCTNIQAMFWGDIGTACPLMEYKRINF